MTGETRSQGSFAGGWLAATLSAVSVTILLPLTAFLASAWLLGWQLQSVQSGSMEPTYPVGSLLVVGAVDPATVEPGSVVVFRDPGDPARLVTHRVVAVATEGGLAFTTKGDANSVPDSARVAVEALVGQPLWSVSHLGRLIDWLAWPRSLVLVVVPALLLVLDSLRSRSRARQRNS